VKGTRRLVLSIVMVAVLVVASIIGFLTGTTPRRGLDLAGGISVVLQGPAGTPKDVMQRAADDIRNRIDALGVAEPDVSIVGNRDIQVQVPGLAHGTITQKGSKFCAKASTGEDLGCGFDSRAAAEAQIQSVGQSRLLALIGRTARLEERQVVSTGAFDPKTTKLTSCPPDFANQPFCDDPKVVQCPLNQPDLPGCSTTALESKQVTYLDKAGQGYYTMGPVQITGDAISKATAVYRTASQNLSSSGHIGWEIDFTLTGSGSKKFATITQNLVNQPAPHNELAIILDRAVESAPTVQSAITGGSGQITGSFSETEAKDLALVLNVGALPVELTKQNVETVSPTLGKTSLHQGLIAGVAGLILLMLYLGFYYRLLGVVTWLGMSIWAVLALALVSVMGKTVGYSLSLAGIAGIIVSMGITADSYIVFYERLKDEVREGKTLRTAVRPAFKRAWHTIVAADIVTILAAAILYLLAIGSVRGFALTLGLSTALDMFVVYFFKRPTVFLISQSATLSNMRGIGLRSGVAADPVPAMAGASE
jgi:preprotein translocase subunit SecD